jgi:pimeloyl-ACP methyl ester carboxylesterase
MALLAEYKVGCRRLPLVNVAAAVPEPALRVDVGQPNQGGPPPFVVRADGERESLERASAESDFARDHSLVGSDGGTRRYTVVPATTMTEQLGETDDLDRWLDEWPAWPACVERVEKTLEMNRAVETYDLPGRLDVNAPALLLTGTEGPSHLRDGVRAVHEALPDSRLVEFDGVSHLGPVEAPDLVTAEVRDFLGERAPARKRGSV